MRFTPTSDQRDFAQSLDKLLAGQDCVGAARSWADGDFDAGRAIWARLAEQGVHALLVGEDHGGMGASHVEMVLAMEAIGRHALPGPYVESVALLAQVASTAAQVGEGTMLTACTPTLMPHLLDSEAAEASYCVSGADATETEGSSPQQSLDPARRLSPCSCQGEIAAAADSAILAVSAQLLGLGESLLSQSVAYVAQRKQFGRAIGSYQALKHQLADVRIALDFARPLVFGAAVSLDARSASAAKVGAGDAAHLAMRTALQVHGAIGYTRELDLSLWLLKVRALQSAWGTAHWHRERIAGLI